MAKKQDSIRGIEAAQTGSEIGEFVASVIAVARPICDRLAGGKRSAYDRIDRGNGTRLVREAMRGLCEAHTISAALVAHKAIMQWRALLDDPDAADGTALFYAAEALGDFISTALPASAADVAARAQFLRDEEETETLSDENRSAIIERLPADIAALRKGRFISRMAWERTPSPLATQFGAWIPREEHEALIFGGAADA